MIFADDIVMCREQGTGGREARGVEVCSEKERNEDKLQLDWIFVCEWDGPKWKSEVTDRRHAVKIVEDFKYLRSTVQSNRGYGNEVFIGRL